MNMGEKLRALQLWRKKSFWILIGLESVLLIWGVCSLFGKNRVYEYDIRQANPFFGQVTEEGWKTEGERDENGILLEWTGISLKPGVYRVDLEYVTDTNGKNMCIAQDSSIGYKALLTNGEHLHSGLGRTDYEMWLYEDTEGLSVKVPYGGEGSLEVLGLTIYETNALNRMILFGLVCLFALVNGIGIFRAYDAMYHVSVQDKTIAFGLLVVVVLVSLPLGADYIVNSGDMVYHLMRIEGIKDSLVAGRFPNRIAPSWQQDYGYASPIFYGETLLYPAALLRLIGFHVTDSYRIFLFMIHGLTALTSYYLFRKLFGHKYIGFFCSALYTLSVYRIYKTYMSGSFGETFGTLFLPFLVYGFFRVFTEETDRADYKKTWIPLTIGYTGLIQSHLLSGEMAGGFTILLCLLCWKKVFRKETFLVLAKTVIYSCILSAWFLVPFLDYMVHGNFVIQNVSGRTIQERGIYVAHLLFTWFAAGKNVFLAQNGMKDTDPMGVGMALVFPLFVWMILLLVKKGNLAGRYKGLGKVTAAFALMAMVMSLSLFPWDRIHHIHPITATLVSSIQFPNRFLTVANVLLTTLAGVVLYSLTREKDKLLAAAYTGIVAVLVLASSIYLLNDILYTTGFSRIYNAKGMGTSYISGAEYLPYGADATGFVYKAPITEENIHVISYEKEPLGYWITCSNDSDREGWLELPLLYYRGYVALHEGQGQVTLYEGNNHLVSAAVGPGFEGTLHITFRSPWYWRVSEGISLAFVILLLVGGRQKRQRGGRLMNKSGKISLLRNMLVGAWKESRFFKALLVLELLLLGLGLPGLFQKSELKLDWPDIGVYTVGTEAIQSTDPVSLPAGVYDLRIQYETSENGRNTLGVQAEGETFYGLLSNEIPLYTGIGERSGYFYLTRHTDRLQAFVSYCGEGDLQIHSIQIYSTNCGARIFLFALILLSFAANLLVLFYLDTEKVFEDTGTRAAFFGIPLAALLASLPLFTDYLIIGADLIFHLLRIEGLAVSMREGVFPVRVESMWLYGHGYANSVFYGDTFLYLPALIRLLGLPVAVAYKFYVAAVNLATAMVAYYSFRGCARLAGGRDSRLVGLAASILYTLAPYRIYNIYNRSAVGEYTAMIFLPVLCYGFYRIFTMEEPRIRDEGGRDWLAWIFPVLGFSGIIQSHTLSCEIVAVFVILLCLIQIRKVFRIRIFLSLAMVVVGTTLVNLWFLVPFLDMMFADKYYFHRAAGILVQKRGVLESTFWYTMQRAGESSKYFENGMMGGEPIALGAGLLAGLALCLVMAVGRRLDKGEKRAVLTAGLIGVAGLYTSSVYFPWDRLQALGGFGATLISSLQFPTRITVIPTACAAFMTCLALAALRLEKKWLWTVACGVMGISVLFAMYQTNDILLTKGDFLRLYTTENIGHSAVLGAEYVPEGVEIPLLAYETGTGSPGVEVTHFEKNGLNTVLDVVVENGQGDYYLELPMIYYKGYKAAMGDTQLALTKGTNGKVRVLLPPGARGQVKVWYGGMWYWHVSEGISLVSILGLAGFYVKEQKENGKNHRTRMEAE